MNGRADGSSCFQPGTNASLVVSTIAHLEGSCSLGSTKYALRPVKRVESIPHQDRSSRLIRPKCAMSEGLGWFGLSCGSLVGEI